MSLSLDINLIVLVVFLFVGGFLLFSSLRKGVQTSRLIVRIARNSCGDTKLIKPIKKRNYLFPATFGVMVNSVKTFAMLPPSALSKIRTAISSKVKSRISPSKPLSSWRVRIVQNAVPYRWLSRMWGKLTHITLPFYWLKYVVYVGWAKMYNCKLEEMRFPLETYRNLSEFFLRPLADETRTIDMAAAMTSPVDGKILHVGSVDMSDLSSVFLEQVKGVTYSLEDFVGPYPAGFDAKSFDSAIKLHSVKESVSTHLKNTKLQTIVMYLAPGDYHYFHSPAEWTIHERRHFPGNLMPVRPWAVEQVKGLYCMNERAVLNGTWKGGYFGFVAVGALNVGSIDLVFDPELETNQNSSYPFQAAPTECKEKIYETPVDQVRGQLMGDFNLGSTVVLIFETSEDFEFDVKAGQTVRVGERIGCESSYLEPDSVSYPRNGEWPTATETI